MHRDHAAGGDGVRLRLSCDACGAAFPLGARGASRDAWCEACQRGVTLPRAVADRPRCACGAALTLEAPRFVELLGALRHLDAVLAAWEGDAAPLAALLPERPRFLTDLDPPASAPDDDAVTRSGLEALRAGAYPRALEALHRAAARDPGRARVWRAIAVAAERVHDLPLAEAALDRCLGAAEDARARLARGALRARRGDFAGARADLERAGDSREAGWNRAALVLLEAVAVTPGLPAGATIAAARAAAGEPSPYWSDATPGRLLWTLLVERARSRAAGDPATCPDARVLRAAEAAFEFDTFWDRALVAQGYAALGMRAEAARVAAGLAREGAEDLAAEPCARAPALAPGIAAVLDAVRAGRPADARAALAPLARRPDLTRYRLPCLACGRGAIGVDEVVEDEAPESGTGA